MRPIGYRQMLSALLGFAAFITQPLAIGAQEAAPGSAATPPVAGSVSESAAPVTPEQVGDALFIHRRYQKAIEAYKKAPKDLPLVWNKMGIAYEMMFDLKDAEHCYKESRRLNPRDARVWNNLGSVYDAMQDHPRAERMYREALKLSPNSAVALRNLGTNLIFQGEYAQGQKLYKRVLALSPTAFDNGDDVLVTTSFVSAHNLGAVDYYKAKEYADAGMTARAIEFLRKALNEGFATSKQIVEDASFTLLRNDPAFQQLMAEQEKK